MYPLLAQGTPIGSFICIGAFCPGSDGSGGATQIENIFTMIVGFLTIVAGLAFLIYFLVGGLQWLTGGGDKGKVDAAKTQMTNGVIGMIVVVASYAIVWIVGRVLGIPILSPAQLIGGL